MHIRRSMFLPFCGVMCGLLLSGCGTRDPFRYVPVSGIITYEDGSLIPVNDMTLMFYPQSPPKDEKTHPRPGVAYVDKATGRFEKATSHTLGDGLVRGKHKVTVVDIFLAALPPDIVPPEYADPQKTPLEVDTADAPFHLKVHKPSK